MSFANTETFENYPSYGFSPFDASGSYGYDSSAFLPPFSSEGDPSFRTQDTSFVSPVGARFDYPQPQHCGFDHVGRDGAAEPVTYSATTAPEFCDPRVLYAPTISYETGGSDSVWLTHPTQGLSTTGHGHKSRGNPKLPEESVILLQDWLIRHCKQPYPTIQEKKDLADATNLTVKQVTNWFNRTRRRKLGKPGNSGCEDAAKYLDSLLLDHDASGSSENNKSVGFVRPARGQSPMERYLDSPPRDEPASLDAIRNAAESAFWQEHHEDVGTKHTRRRSSSTDSESYVVEQTTSDRGYDSITMSGASSGSRGSHSSYASHASWAGRKGRRKHQGGRNPQMPWSQSQRYQCTWCGSSFRRPSDWQRHEESKHAPQVEWICLLHANPEDEFCAFCSRRNPTLEHYDRQHNAIQCFFKPRRERAFDRKDHLRQHIRQVHGQSAMPPLIDTWARPVANSTPADGWRCGFCHVKFTHWENRVKHVRVHFESGLDIRSWDLSPTSISLSRPSRCALPNPNLYGCSWCRRCFKTKSELQDHRLIPHLARSRWTCGDAYSALLSSIPDPLDIYPDTSLGQVLNATMCFHCGGTQQPSHNFWEWKEWIKGHFLGIHNFSNCQESFLDANVFRDHLAQSHGIFPDTLISTNIIGHVPFEIYTTPLN